MPLAAASFAIHVVEDDSSVRDAVRELVASEGRAVRCYDSPQAFFAGPPPGPRDIVVLDVHFPTGSGVEAAERLRRDYPETRIVLISGIRGAPYARALAAIAPQASFRKPLDPAAFVDCINALAAT